MNGIEQRQRRVKRNWIWREIKIKKKEQRGSGLDGYNDASPTRRKKAHTEAKVTGRGFHALILYLYLRLLSLRLSNLVNAKTTHSLGKYTKISSTPPFSVRHGYGNKKCSPDLTNQRTTRKKRERRSPRVPVAA